MDTLKLAETESTLWAEAQILNEQRTVPQVAVTSLPSIPGRWCFTYGSWKESDSFSGQVWLSTLEGFTGLLRARNVWLAFLLFMQKWKCYSGQWNAWEIYVNSMLRLQRIVLNWWRWFRHQKNDQLLQIIWKISRSWKRVSSKHKSSIFQGYKIQWRIIV